MTQSGQIGAGYRGDQKFRGRSNGARRRLTCIFVVGLPGFEPGTS